MPLKVDSLPYQQGEATAQGLQWSDCIFVAWGHPNMRRGKGYTSQFEVLRRVQDGTASK